MILRALNSIVWSSLDYHFLFSSQVFKKLIMICLSFLFASLPIFIHLEISQSDSLRHLTIHTNVNGGRGTTRIDDLRFSQILPVISSKVFVFSASSSLVLEHQAHNLSLFNAGSCSTWNEFQFFMMLCSFTVYTAQKHFLWLEFSNSIANFGLLTKVALTREISNF